jgi:hemerythrin-like domain-containing protein
MDKSGADVLTEQHQALQELFHRVSQPDEDRRKVLKTIVQTLAAHVAMEKQVLVPALKEHVGDSEAMVSRLEEDHDQVGHLLTLLERRKANSPDVPDMVTELLDLTDRHVSEADRQIIPALRTSLDPVTLDELGANMESDERQLLTHPHPVLPDSGPLAGVSRKMAGVVDKLRDNSDDIGRSGS